MSREAQVAAELRRESERKKGKPEGARVKLGGEDSSPEGEPASQVTPEPACFALSISQITGERTP